MPAVECCFTPVYATLAVHCIVGIIDSRYLHQLVPTMIRIYMSNRTRCGPHHHRMGACTTSPILHPTQKIPGGNPSGGEIDILAFDQVAGLINAGSINALCR